MKGYWIILGTEIRDHESQTEYGRLWSSIATKYEAKINPTKIPPLLKEARDLSRVTIVEFPSYESAQACYNDPAYQAAKEYALKASNRELLIIEGKLN